MPSTLNVKRKQVIYRCYIPAACIESLNLNDARPRREGRSLEFNPSKMVDRPPDRNGEDVGSADCVSGPLPHIGCPAFDEDVCRNVIHLSADPGFLFKGLGR